MTINLDAMLAKRREAVGDAKGFPVEFGGKTFYFTAPELASSDFNDRFDELQRDVQDGLMTAKDVRAEFLDMFLGEQADEFAALCEKEKVDPTPIILYAVQEHNEAVAENPTQMRSRNSRKPVKRR